MHMSCKPGNNRVYTLILLAIGFIAISCGGGGDDSQGDTNPNVPETASWERLEVLKLEGDQPINPNLQAQMDSQGRIHFFYYRRGETYDGNQVRYQIHHLIWDSETATLIGEEEMLGVQPPNPGTSDSGLSNCLVLDVEITTDDNPVVAYQGGRIPQADDSVICNYIDQGDLMVNGFNGTSWEENLGIQGDASTKNPYFTDGYIGISAAVAVDSQNAIHFVGQHYYEFCDWTASNYPDLLYVKQTQDQLGHYSVAMEEFVDDYNIYSDGGAVTQSHMGKDVKIILDADDNPIVFYVGAPNQDGLGEDRTSLRMSRKIGGVWQAPEIIDFLEDWRVEFISPAIAPDGTLGVAYFMEDVAHTTYPDHLRYAFRQADGQWDIDIVDVSSHCGDFCSLAYDDNSMPAIAYYDIHANAGAYRPREDLKFARFVNGRWEREAVATAGDIGKYNTVWFDANGIVYISTYEFNEQQIIVFRERVQ